MSSEARPQPWLHDDRTQLAQNRILDAAGEAFVELGVTQASMEDVARFASCSRGTVYRYFKNRHELRLAYIEREARRIHGAICAATEAIDDPAEALLEAMMVALSEVRGNPTLTPWFDSAGQGTTNLIAGSSEIMFEMIAFFLDSLLEPAATAGQLRSSLDRRDTAEWLTRIILSLLTVRGPKLRSVEQEFEYLRTFLLPVLFEPNP